jgi:DNA-binding NarL/FixJ family response regulator
MTMTVRHSEEADGATSRLNSVGATLSRARPPAPRHRSWQTTPSAPLPARPPLPESRGAAEPDRRSALDVVAILSSRRVFADALAHTLARRGFSAVVLCPAPEAPVAALITRGLPERCCCVLDLGGGRAAEQELIGQLGVARPQARLLLLTTHTDRGYVTSALAAGAAGVVDMQQSLDLIEHSLHSIAGGRRAVHVSGPLCESDPADPALNLTRREREVLALIVAGKGARSVAAEFGVAYSTARAHIQSILRKLGVHSRLEAAAVAAERGLV